MIDEDDDYGNDGKSTNRDSRRQMPDGREQTKKVDHVCKWIDTG